MKTAAGALPGFLAALTDRPGVYRMLDGQGNVIYVGKARNLRKRVSSYFSRPPESPKTSAMVGMVRNVEVTVTRTEGEALLLESNLIKSLRPRYNVSFRDDKSYPYIYLDQGHPFPRFAFHRGSRTGKGRYFGPYPSAASARSTLNLVQRLFRVRQCEDSYYRSRSRPCLQHQIGRCSAPCVGLVPAAEYAADVENSVLFLEGRNREVIASLTAPMEKAAADLDFERAARYRDQIAALRRIQERQVVSTPAGECDVIACAMSGGEACVQLFMVRGGRNLGNRAYYPRGEDVGGAGELLRAFLSQHYVARSVAGDLPAEILVSAALPEQDLLESVLTERRGGTVRIRVPARGVRARWMDMARENAQLALHQRSESRLRYAERLQGVAELLDLPVAPARVECFDISHTGGESTVASCVVFGTDGPEKSAWRRFKVEGLAPGDDYGAMAQVLGRRYRAVNDGAAPRPDLILIDGGRGQVDVAAAVLAEAGLGDVALAGMVKGEGRRPGQDGVVVRGRGKWVPATGHAGMLLLQEIRDEAHRFAITGHRNARRRARSDSSLESIAGIGAARRRALLRHFGGLQGIQRAGVDDLAKVTGIHKNLAQRIYSHFHGDA